MKISLAGKRVLVTGSSRGIGLAIVKTLLECDADIVAQYRSLSEELKQVAEVSGKVDLIQGDLSSREFCRSLVETCQRDFGTLHAVVNNAGVCIEANLSASNWEESWDEQFEVNTRAVAVICKEACLHFSTQNSGYIVNVSSRAAFRGDAPTHLGYAASKGAIVALTRSIARGFGKQGIKAFIIAPGFIKTRMADEFIAQYGEEFVKGDLALDEMTTPEHIGPTVAFLISGLADHLTGTTIDINAGSYVH